MQERVYREKIQDVEELRHRIQQEWERLDQRIIDDAVRRWHTRLSACVAAGGGHLKNYKIADYLPTHLTVKRVSSFIVY
jgi:NAD dependent epimerase/dehydratase family enzyme